MILSIKQNGAVRSGVSQAVRVRAATSPRRCDWPMHARTHDRVFGQQEVFVIIFVSKRVRVTSRWWRGARRTSALGPAASPSRVNGRLNTKASSDVTIAQLIIDNNTACLRRRLSQSVIRVRAKIPNYSIGFHDRRTNKRNIFSDEIGPIALRSSPLEVQNGRTDGEKTEDVEPRTCEPIEGAACARNSRPRGARRRQLHHTCKLVFSRVAMLKESNKNIHFVSIKTNIFSK
ncbi:hypothetical protein EVAR_45834_1 [Eumeta japonica]|uniref:Uncharacterized protein n=1 Tax=Eumeta variegata TaxID=151549 RepID=A0A4C1WPD3_EUMVA|nr:hypothetical protein EVAR_45834_1 [Eumeta japonica]